MSGFLAVDFGTTNTVITLWDEVTQSGVPLYIPDYSRVYQIGTSSIPVVPSLIHYAAQNRKWLGNQIFQKNLYPSERTFRWMKRYISNRSPIQVRLDGTPISPSQAGREFLSSILLIALQEIDRAGRFNPYENETAFCVPVEAFEHYENWLAGVAESTGILRFRLIDEPSAAALGYGAHIQPGNVYLVLDFGGGTMHAAVVRIEDDNSNNTGRKCRVLGKAGKDIGGSTIDMWLFEEVLRRNHRTDSDADILTISNAILVECERVKEILSTQNSADLLLMHPETGSVVTADFSRDEFEDLLDRHNLFSDMDQTIRSALNAAREKGFNEDSIQSVLMVGGSSQIPAIQQTVRRIFGKERVFSDRPLDAVARGAAAFIAGVDFYDHIQHDYAIRFINPQTGTYEYRSLVQRGTPYPSQEPIARLSIKASYDGQTQMGIAIFEISQASRGSGKDVELVFDPSGAARIMPVTPHILETRSHFWMNEHNPTFLKAEPPARKSEARFDVEFWIDSNKRLTVTARDLVTGILTHKDFPVVKLS